MRVRTRPARPHCWVAASMHMQTHSHVHIICTLIFMHTLTPPIPRPCTPWTFRHLSLDEVCPYSTYTRSLSSLKLRLSVREAVCGACVDLCTVRYSEASPYRPAAPTVYGGERKNIFTHPHAHSLTCDPFFAPLHAQMNVSFLTVFLLVACTVLCSYAETNGKGMCFLLHASKRF